MATTDYEIRDITGELIAVHRRIDTPDGRKQISWHLPDGSHGLQGRRLSSLPFYHSELLTAWQLDAWIFIVEGEKTADALLADGRLGLGTYGASAIPDPEVLQTLHDRNIVLSPDNDDPGRKHMIDIGDRLRGIVTHQLWLEPPADAPKGWDLADATLDTDFWTAARTRLSPVPRAAPPPPVRAPRPVTLPKDNHLDFAAIKAQIDILDYIAGATGSVKRRGRAYITACPVHSDQHPSLHIYPDTQSWYCYVCQEGGDVFDFERFRSGTTALRP